MAQFAALPVACNLAGAPSNKGTDSQSTMTAHCMRIGPFLITWIVRLPTTRTANVVRRPLACHPHSGALPPGLKARTRGPVRLPHGSVLFMSPAVPHQVTPQRIAPCYTGHHVRGTVGGSLSLQRHLPLEGSQYGTTWPTKLDRAVREPLLHGAGGGVADGDGEQDVRGCREVRSAAQKRERVVGYRGEGGEPA